MQLNITDVRALPCGTPTVLGCGAEKKDHDLRLSSTQVRLNIHDGVPVIPNFDIRVTYIVKRCKEIQ